MQGNNSINSQLYHEIQYIVAKKCSWLSFCLIFISHNKQYQKQQEQYHTSDVYVRIPRVQMWYNSSVNKKFILWYIYVFA